MSFIVTPSQLIRRGQFYRQLGQLIAAGIPIIKALDMLTRNPPARSFQQPIQLMIARLSEGSTFAEAMHHLGNWVPSFDLALVEAGEKSGRLDQVFRLLADYYEDRAAVARRMIGDLLYPVFLFHFGILIFAFIEWFKGGTSLFGFALGILEVLIPIYVVVFLMLFGAQGKRGVKWRSFLEKLLRPVPLLGAARHCLALSRLSAALEALINAGMNILEAWEMAAAASGSPAMYRTVLAWRPQVNAGQTPAETVRAARSQFPELFANLYYSGEVSGQLDETLRRLHVYYRDEGTQKVRMLTLIIPKAIYLGVAAFVAFKVITFYTGYFNDINKAIGGK
jgi:type II secretory pathway component PulF